MDRPLTALEENEESEDTAEQKSQQETAESGRAEGRLINNAGYYDHMHSRCSKILSITANQI